LNKPLLLIDGDQFIHKATAALEREVRWDDQNHVLYSNVEECWDNVKAMLDRIFERFSSTDHALCFTSAPNFRRELIDPTYKAARGQRKPLCYAALRERVDGNYNTVSYPGLEADDVMGILATKPGQRDNIIVSQDKDMKTIPTTVWDGKDLIKITEREANYWHLYQTLVGDSSDGYKGCPGVGPVKARQILELPYWGRVVFAFEKAGLGEAAALTQARLARILRWNDWDTEEKKPKLWIPNL
jgi:DNA polymerase-1